jgi:hypothetical protein
MNHSFSNFIKTSPDANLALTEASLPAEPAQSRESIALLAALEILSKCPIPALRPIYDRIKVEVSEGKLILSGDADLFYNKQSAQETLKPLSREFGLQIKNNIKVR